jgi:flavin reductase (DIM6/NTAB) family NADH-FMN oxidoreductase RutF
MKKSLGSKTLAYPAPVWCIGSYDQNGLPNVMTVAWGGICSSKPPCVTISLRKATYTYGNIVAKKAYTISIPSEKYAKEADYFGMVSGKNINKFEKTGLTPVKSTLVDAPYVAEFPITLECRVIHLYEIGIHTQFVGEVVDVKADEHVINIEKGLPEIDKIKPVIFSPEIRTYHGVGKHLGLAFEMGKYFI